MKFTRDEIHHWHKEGIEVAERYLRCEHRMVELLALMAESRGYYIFGCGSLVEYTCLMWKLPQGAARDLVTVARKTLEIPSMIAALESGKATVSKLRKVCPVITPQDQDEWLEVVEKHSSREIERAVAEIAPETAVPTRLTYKSKDILEMKTGISKALAEKLNRVQEIGEFDLPQALAAMADHWLKSFDPIQKAERALKRGAKRHKRVTGPSARTQHEVTLRDQAQCTHIGKNGERCPNRRWIEVHHRKPRADGGGHELANLQTLCSGHHRMVHAKSLSR